MSILGCLDRPTSGRYCLKGSTSRRRDESGTREHPQRAHRVRVPELQPARAHERASRTPHCRSSTLSARAPVPPIARARAARRSSCSAWDRAGNTPAQLSGGEQQRVAIARALINSPSVLLADEPTGNLDTRNSHDIMQTLVRFNREQGVTIVVVTHESDIAAYAERVITMRDGRSSRTSKAPAQEARAERPTRRRTPTIQTPPRQGAGRIDRGGIVACALMIGGAALQALTRNKLRSALTMLGRVHRRRRADRDGGGRAGCQPGRTQADRESRHEHVRRRAGVAVTMGGSRGGFGSSSSLTVADADAIRREAPPLRSWAT